MSKTANSKTAFKLLGAKLILKRNKITYKFTIIIWSKEELRDIIDESRNQDIYIHLAIEFLVQG